MARSRRPPAHRVREPNAGWSSGGVTRDSTGGCQGHPKPDAAVVRFRIDAIPPKHLAMKIPVVMAPTPQSALPASAEIGTPSVAVPTTAPSDCGESSRAHDASAFSAGGPLYWFRKACTGSSRAARSAGSAHAATAARASSGTAAANVPGSVGLT